MMDLSDGLATDGARLAAANGLACLVDPAAVPVHPDAAGADDPPRAAFADGEDYELLVAVTADGWEELAAAWPFTLPLTRIGTLVAGQGVLLVDGDGRRPCPWTLSARFCWCVPCSSSLICLALWGVNG
jgi:thiamine-monophosphate kinase